MNFVKFGEIFGKEKKCIGPSHSILSHAVYDKGGIANCIVVTFLLCGALDKRDKMPYEN